MKLETATLRDLLHADLLRLYDKYKKKKMSDWMFCACLGHVCTGVHLAAWEKAKNEQRANQHV